MYFSIYTEFCASLNLSLAQWFSSYIYTCLLMQLFDFLRIGTEHEKFGFEFNTLQPMKYEQIAELLNGISERFDWDKVVEGDYIIGLKQVN